MSPLDKLHDQAMEAAFLADLERRRGNEEQAAKLFDEALDLELKAIAEMTTPIEPTWSILHRSAGWLALDCNQPARPNNSQPRPSPRGRPRRLQTSCATFWNRSISEDTKDTSPRQSSDQMIDPQDLRHR